MSKRGPLTDWTWLQHWMGPVLQELPVGLEDTAVDVTVTVIVFGGSPPGMAAARMESEKRK